MRISDWSSDVCSSDLPSGQGLIDGADVRERPRRRRTCVAGRSGSAIDADPLPGAGRAAGSGEGGMTQADLATDRKSVVEGKSVSVRVDLGGRRIIKKEKRTTDKPCTTLNKTRQLAATR